MNAQRQSRDLIYDDHGVRPHALFRVMRQVQNHVCLCGNNKTTGHPFCKNCKSALLEADRKKLDRMISPEFAIAYNDAERFLQQRERDKLFKQYRIEVHAPRRGWASGERQVYWNYLIQGVTIATAFIGLWAVWNSRERIANNTLQTSSMRKAG